MYHRLTYGLRHGQHHIGKLTAYLNLEGVQLNHWKGKVNVAADDKAHETAQVLRATREAEAAGLEALAEFVTA